MVCIVVFRCMCIMSTGLVHSVQEFHINILPMDDGTPVLQANLGLEFLEKFESLVSKSNCYLILFVCF